MPMVAHSLFEGEGGCGSSDTSSNHESFSTCGAVGRCCIVFTSKDRSNCVRPGTPAGIRWKGGVRVFVAWMISFIVAQPSMNMPPGVVAVLGPEGGILSIKTCMI